jgi:hypothetical protein
MANHKLLSGRVKVTPVANVAADRYNYLGLEQAEPNLGVANADGYVLTYSTASPGGRQWQSSSLLSGGLVAQSAFATANNAEALSTSAYAHANSSYIHANAAFAAANSAAGSAIDNVARTQSNSSYIHANSAFDKANTGSKSTASSTAPGSPSIGDMWYDTETDVLLRYTYDGTSNNWIDITGPIIRSNYVRPTYLITANAS